MNKDKLAQELAIQHNLSKAGSRKILDTLFDRISKALINKNDVSIVGFGRFEVRERKSRKGRNPQTGETIVLPASSRVAFTPSKTINDAVKERS